MTRSTRCATHALETILAEWKQEPSPYESEAYAVPTCQREKILPESVKRQPTCATPAMAEILKLEAEYDQRIAAGETEEMILQSWKDRGI